MNWKSIVASIVANVIGTAIVSICATFFIFGQRIARLETQMEQLLAEKKAPSAVAPVTLPSEGMATTENAPTPVNVERLMANDQHTPHRISARVLRIEWDTQLNMIVQLYRDDRLIFPKNPHEQNSSGVAIDVTPGLYEVKLWNPDAFTPIKVTWLEVVRKQ